MNFRGGDTKISTLPYSKRERSVEEKLTDKTRIDHCCISRVLGEKNANINCHACTHFKVDKRDR